MPSLKIRTPILGGRYYHIFNRGARKGPLFITPDNYLYFLNLIKHHLIDFVEILAYCLLPNHFHLVIRTKDSVFEKETESLEITNEEEVGKIIVKQFRKLFVTYSMAINKQENKVGNLFDPRYKRIEITNNEYLKYVIFYTHFNPVKHGLSGNLYQYKYSSYKSILTHKMTHLSRDHVFEIYDGREDFINYHAVLHDERKEVIME